MRRLLMATLALAAGFSLLGTPALATKRLTTDQACITDGASGLDIDADCDGYIDVTVYDSGGIDPSVYRADDPRYSTGSSTGGLQEAWDAAQAAGGGIVLLPSGTIDMTAPFVCNTLDSSSTDGGMIIGRGTTRIAEATNGPLDNVGTVLRWDDAAADNYTLEKAASMGGSSGDWLAGDTVTWDSGSSSGTIVSVNFTTLWINLDVTTGSLPSVSEVITNSRSSQTATMSSGSTTDRQLGAMFRLDGCSQLKMENFTLIGDEGADGGNPAKFGILIRARNSTSALSSGIALQHMRFLDFTTAGVWCDGDYPASHSGQCDQIRGYDVRMDYTGLYCMALWGDAAVGNVWDGGLCRGWTKAGVLIGGSAAITITGVDGVSGDANGNRSDDPKPGEPFGGIVQTPSALAPIVTLTGVRFENLITRVGYGTAGACSEDIADSTLDVTEWTLCTEDAECSGTCDYDDGTTGSGQGIWSISGGGLSISNLATHTGSDNASTLTDSTANFPSNWVGLTVYNKTDGSSCTITSITSTTVTCTLTGGTDNDWDLADKYDVGPRFGVYFQMDGGLGITALLVGGAGADPSAISNTIYSNPDATGVLDYVGPQVLFGVPYTMDIETNDPGDGDGIRGAAQP